MLSTRSALRALGHCGCLLFIALAGCRSHTDEGSPICTVDRATATAAPQLPAVWSMRRLTRNELARTLDALVGVIPESVKQLPPDASDLWATPPAPSSFEVDVYRQIANEAADAGSKALLARWGCGRDAPCVRAAVAHWIDGAYRAPLASKERDAYLALFASGRDPRPALQGVLQLLFQSPRFLYVIERGISRDEHEDSRELTAWELATRLSYFLWSEPPDAALQDDAATGRLSDTTVLQAHVRRLLRDPKAARAVGTAFQQWAAPELDIVAKSDAVYPEFDPKLRASMLAQFERFAAMVIADGYSFADLITTPRAPVDARLASLLGIDADFGLGTKRESWKVVDLEPLRFGLLTLPGVLTANARADDSSPVQRGLFIRQNVLCQPVAPPPAGVPALPPSDSSGTSFRERFEAHTRSPACAGCHKLMDPLGFPFEVYDGLGRLRSDRGSIRTEGQLDGVATPTGFTDLQGLVDALLTAPEVSHCWAQQWLQRSLGPDAARDGGLIDQLATSVTRGASLSDLIAQIITAPAFRRVSRPQIE